MGEENFSSAVEEIRQNLLKGELTKKQLHNLKISVANKYELSRTPSNIELVMSLNLNEDENKAIAKRLITKPGRSMSGVSVVAIMTEPRLCPHGKCIFCPGGPKSAFGDVPMAYTGREPASMRGERTGYDAYLQVFTRLEQYVAAGHMPQKIELIVMGGTLPSYESQYQEKFVRDAFNAMNDFSELFFIDSSTLNYDKFKGFFEMPGSVYDEKRVNRVHDKIRELKSKNNDDIKASQKKNETAFVKCIGMTIETRPDFAKLEHANTILEQGGTRVELGVQSVYDHILEMTGRSHGSAENIESIRILKDLGFKVNFHLMPGLPGVSYEEDLEGLKQIFSDKNYRPDMIKIYPTGVFPGTVLYDYYKLGMYKPLRVDDAVKLLADFKPCIPEYCRVMRVQRDIPSTMLTDGVLKTNLRQMVHEEMKRRKTECRCIRCREIGHKLNKIKELKPSKEEIKITEYDASKGKEFFISFEDTTNDMIIGFVRLRFPSQSIREEVTDTTSFIRELHVYGNTELLGKKGITQHRGIGKILMKKAEEIALKNGYDKMLVISGIGVRQYYAKLGYVLEGPYMSKRLI